MKHKNLIHANVDRYIDYLISGRAKYGDGFFRNGQVYIANMLIVETEKITIIAKNIDESIEFHHSKACNTSFSNGADTIEHKPLGQRLHLH